MNNSEHIEIKEESAQAVDTTQDGILPASDSPARVIKSFAAQQVADGFTSTFFDGAACRERILKILHPDGAFCPYCHFELTNGSAEKFWAMQYTTCRACGKRFLATKGTILHNTSLSMRQAFALACLIALGLSNKQIAEIVGIHPDSVRLWRLKLNG